MADPTPIDMLIAVGSNLPGIQTGITVIAAIVGFYCIGHGLIVQLRSGRGGAGQQILPSTFAWLISGSLLLSMPILINTVTESVFGANARSDARTGLSYLGPTATTETEAALEVIVYIIAVIGWIAVARGLFIWRSGPDVGQPGWFARGLIFIIGGALCTNVEVLTDYLAGSVGQSPFGTQYLNY